MKRIVGTGRNGAIPRALKARIILRNKLKREPDSTEVLEYLMSHLDNNIPFPVVGAAFRAGEEVRPKFVCLGDRVVKSSDILRKWFVRSFNA